VDASRFLESLSSAVIAGLSTASSEADVHSRAAEATVSTMEPLILREGTVDLPTA